MKNVKNLLALACVAVASPVLAQTTTPPPRMEFGGMYGFGSNRNYPNPYTNGLSCPTGYGAYRILGTPGIDHNVFFCGRVPTSTTVTAAVADFGGMYGYGATQNYRNPLTGGFSCPTGFTATQMLGTANMDYEMFLCHRPGTTTPLVTFGGMFGGYWKDGAHQTYPNPLTGAGSCPSTYSAAAFLGTLNIDYVVWSCYK